MELEQAVATIATDPPRRLRMSELLAELGALEDEATPEVSAQRTRKLAVGVLVDKAAEAGFAFLVGILTLIAIPFFGLSTPFGLAIALVGAQMMVGLRQPWLPARARRRELAITMLDRCATMLARRTRWIVKLTRRRWAPLVQPRLAGLFIVVLALGLALPIPIPGSNLIFLIPLFVLAIGVLEQDGAWIAAGIAFTLVDVGLVVAFGATVLIALRHCWHWLF